MQFTSLLLPELVEFGLHFVHLDFVGPLHAAAPPAFDKGFLIPPGHPVQHEWFVRRGLGGATRTILLVW